jgi:hypothetical protein
MRNSLDHWLTTPPEENEPDPDEMDEMRDPTEDEMEEANQAYNEWRKAHEQLATIERAREIFYHGYLIRLLENAD